MTKSKTLHKVQLVAIDGIGIPVRSGNCDDMAMFIARSEDDNFRAIPAGDTLELYTPKGRYVLTKHPTFNYWKATCNGIKVQVSLKRMVGSLRYWA